MQLDTVITGLKLLTALSLVCVTHLVLLPYFLKPEEFFIKRFRPEHNHKFTHADLLARAFLGAGLISTGLYSLALCLALSLVVGTAWAWAWVWLVLTLDGGVVVGTGCYIGFRILRYRKLAADERLAALGGETGVFVRRSP